MEPKLSSDAAGWIWEGGMMEKRVKGQAEIAEIKRFDFTKHKTQPESTG